MIRAVIHPLNEQPLVVELLEMPNASDAAVICRNARTIDGKRPAYIDRPDSTFAFPYASLRFVEVYASADAGAGRVDEPQSREPSEPDELEIDEDFLRRVREA
jgi:hypothetical protein